MNAVQNRAGVSLKHLRTSHNVSQQLVASMAGTTTAYLAKVEDGVLTPTNSYVARITKAIVMLMTDPPRPCAVIGCDNTKHLNKVDGAEGSSDWHHALERRGEGWTADVEWTVDQDPQWVVYVEVSDDTALSAVDFLALTAAYNEATIYADVLNRRVWNKAL